MKYYAYTVRELLLKIMAILAKVSTQLPSVIVDLSLYYCCTAHQALAALLSLCVQRAVQEPFDRCAWVYAICYTNTYMDRSYSTLCTTSDTLF